jgi:electron transfer flavoprotein alpha/beta subunit
VTRIAAIIGSAPLANASGTPTLPMSDRGALALAMTQLAGDVRAYAADSEARCFARAVGVETVAGISDLELGAFDVALIGRGGCAERGDLLPAQLAEESGAALVYDVIDVQPEADCIVVTRDLGRGARDLLSVRGRAVLVVAESVERGPYVSRHRLNAARVVSRESAACDAPSSVEWEPATPRVKLGDHAARVAGSAVERMNALFGMGEVRSNTASLVHGNAEECARHLLRYLSHHEFVERGLGGKAKSAADEVARSQPVPKGLGRSAMGDASIPIRVRRCPRALHQSTPPARGPFEIGVDR